MTTSDTSGANSTDPGADQRSSQARDAIFAAARELLEAEGTIEAVTMARIAEATHYATSVVHYHTGGVEALRDELFQMLAVDYSLAMLLGSGDIGRERNGNDVILAAGEWVKQHPASTRFLAGRESKEIREPGLSAAKSVFGIDLAADPDGLSITRFIHRSFFNPTTLILDAEEGAGSIGEETIVALGMLTWRHLRASLAVLARRPQTSAPIDPDTYPLPGITAPVPARLVTTEGDQADPTPSEATLAEARRLLTTQGPAAIAPHLAPLLHQQLVREFWDTVLDLPAVAPNDHADPPPFDDDASDRFLAWITARPALARFVFFSEGCSAVPDDPRVIGALLPDVAVAPKATDAVLFHLTRQLGALLEVIGFAIVDEDAQAAISTTLESSRRVLLAAGVVS